MTQPPSDGGVMSDDRRQVLAAALPVIALLAFFGWAARLGLERVFTPWQADWLPWLCAIAAALGWYAHHAMRDLEGWGRVAYLAAQAVALTVAIKLLLVMRGGLDQLLLDLPRWQSDLGTLFTAELVAGMAFAALAWWSGYAFAADLNILFDRDEQQGFDDLGLLQNNLRGVRGGMTARIFFLGALATGFAVLARVDLGTLASSAPGGLATLPDALKRVQPVAAVLLYFVFALALLALAQFAMLRTRWRWQKTPVLAADTPGAAHLPAAWLRWSLLFLLLIAAVALLLPTRYSIGFFDTLRLAIELIFRLAAALMVLLLLPLGWLASLLRFGDSPQAPALPEETPAPIIPPPVAGAPPADWWLLAQSILFWLVFAAVIGIGLATFVRQNRALWNIVLRLGVSEKLSAAWNWLRALLVGARRLSAQGLQNTSALIRAGARRLRRARRAARRVEDVPALDSARARVVRDYLALLRLAAQEGVPRAAHQTPAAYAARLTTRLPESQSEIDALSHAFEEARYAAHPIPADQSARADTWLERLRHALRRAE